ncbi:MAG: tail fiber domain-containing protein [Saprospirales bacterium]|nr:tail fiber domain-containing protein [Saprospirales bacterium]
MQLRTQNSGSNVNALYVEPNGNVGIGTTSPSGRKLRVLGDSEQDGKVYYTSALRTEAFGGFDVTCWNEGGGKYEVGRVVSSRRYKENIQPFEPNAERLLDIQLKSWTGINDTTGTIGFGYIAEEVDSLGLKDAQSR